MLKPPYSKYYRLIQKHYSDKYARRSDVPLINHIDEGLIIMEFCNASSDAMAAYCLHPLFQNETDLSYSISKNIFKNFDPYILLLVMEYRHTANSFLCRPNTDQYTLADLPEIINNDMKSMLIADKIQNRKDCDLYHQNHERYHELSNYFRLWLKHLGVDENRYQRIIKEI